MMFSTNELKRVYGIAIGLLVIAAASYAAFPSKSPERPIRIAFQTVAGKVIFDHNRHWVESGYSLFLRGVSSHLVARGVFPGWLLHRMPRPGRR